MRSLQLPGRISQLHIQYTDNVRIMGWAVVAHRLRGSLLTKGLLVQIRLFFQNFFKGSKNGADNRSRQILGHCLY